MKTIALFTLTLAFSFCNAQILPSDLTDKEIPVTWLGLDCTEMRIVAPADADTDWPEAEVLSKMWNNQILDNRRRYPLNKAFHRKSVAINTEPIQNLNARQMAESWITYDLYLLYSENIKRAFQRYNFSGKGIGYSFLIESIDLTQRHFSGYMMAIDLEQQRMIKAYYLKARFSHRPKNEELVKPFRQVLVEFAEVLTRKPEEFEYSE